MRKRRTRSHKISQDIAQATIGTHARVSSRTHNPRARVSLGQRGLGAFEGKTQRSGHARQSNTQHISHVLDVEGRASQTNAQAQRQSQAHSLRARKRHFAYKKVLLMTCFVIVVLALTGFVASAAFFGSLSSRMNLDDEQAQALLSPVQRDTKIEYILVEGTSEANSREPDQADMLLLIALDRQEKKARSFIIPANMQAKDQQGQERPLKDLYTSQTSAFVLETINKKLGISINHLIRINKDSFKGFIDSLQGISCNIPEEIDDPYAGKEYIAQGEQTLNGQEAYVALRARNYKTSSETQAAIQAIILQAIFNKIQSEPLQNLPGLLESISGVIKSDLSAEELLKLLDVAKIISTTPQVSVLPGSFYLNNETSQAFAFNLKAWEVMLDNDLFSAEENPRQEEASASRASRELSDEARKRIEEAATLNKEGKLTLIVRNGSGIDGAAGEIETRLKENGFSIKDTGNAESFVYDDTIVVYKDEKYRDDAQAIVDALGFGRTTDQSIFYSFKSDILVVVGKDFKPR